jgi:hypothetical protein
VVTATDARSLAALHALHQAGQSLAVASPGALLAAHLVTVPLAWWRPRLAMGLVAGLGALQCTLAFPRTGNHLFLGVIVSLVLALLDPAREEERRLRTDALLAMALLVFAWSGVHKLIHGLWFRGETLAWLAVSRADVGAVLRPLLSEGVAAGLGASSRVVEGSGPFRLSGGWVVVSNAVWLSELGVVGLWHPRLRSLAPWALLGLAWTVQLIAHEWEFALLLTTMLLPAGSRLRGVAALAVVALALIRLGVIQAPFWAVHLPEPV